MERNSENHHGLEYPELNPPLEDIETLFMSFVTETLYSKFKEHITQQSGAFHVKINMTDEEQHSVNIFCNWLEKDTELGWHENATQEDKAKFGFLLDMAVGRFYELVDIYIKDNNIHLLNDTSSDSVDWSAEIMKFIKMTKNPAQHYSVDGQSMRDALSGQAGEIDGYKIMTNWCVYGCENSLSRGAYFIPEGDAMHFFKTVHQAMKNQGSAVYHTLTSVKDIAYSEILETLNALYPADKVSEMRKNTQQVFGTEDYGIVEIEHEGSLFGCLIALKNEWGGYVSLANVKLS